MLQTSSLCIGVTHSIKETIFLVKFMFQPYQLHYILWMFFIYTLEERRNRADLIELFKIYKGFTTVHFESLFTLDRNNKGISGHLAKLSKPRVPERGRKIFLFTSCN